MTHEFSLLSASAEQTEQLAFEIASRTPSGSIFALYGDLGAGKTVFARGFARGLGISEPVSSPTFTIVQEYPHPNGIFFHLDLYRIDNSSAALAFGIDDFLFDPEALSLLEWPERIEDLLPPETIRVRIAHTQTPDARFIHIENLPFQPPFPCRFA